MTPQRYNFFPIGYYTREPLTDYGTPFAVDLRHGERGIEAIVQKYLSCPSGLGLYPTKPTLPLLPPNNYAELKKEPCMGDRKRLQENINLLSTKGTRVGHVAKSVQGQNRMKLFLEKLTELENADDDDKMHLYHSLIDETMKDLSGIADVIRFITGSTPMLSMSLGDLKVNSNFTGGCLSYLPYHIPSSNGSSGVLVYPTGKTLSEIAFSQVTFVKSRLDMMETKLVVSLQDGGRILETKVIHCQRKDFALFRQTKQCSLFQFAGPESTDAEPFAELVMSHTWKGVEAPASISLSPYIASEFVVSTNTGSIYLWSPHTPKRRLKKVHSEEMEVGWTGCHFGSDARSVIFANQSSVQILDIGERERCMKLLFSLPHQAVNPKDKIRTIAKHPSKFHHLVATDEQVLLLNESYVNHPILKWRPDFRSPPQYMMTFSSVLPSPAVDDIVIVATQDTAETFCLQFHREHLEPSGTYPYQACENPWRVSKVDDFARFAADQGHGRYRPLTKRRLEVPLAGICGVSWKADSRTTGISIIQMTSFGDLFYQDYLSRKSCRMKEKTFSYGPGCEEIRLSSEDLHLAGQWLDEARKQFEDGINAEVASLSNCVDASNILKGIQHTVVANANCCICNRQTCDDADDSEDMDDMQHCSSCKMTLSDSRAILQAVKKGQAIPGCTGQSTLPSCLDSCLPAFDLSNFKDPESRLLLKLWRNETENIKDELIEREEQHRISLADQVNLSDEDASENHGLDASENHGLDDSITDILDCDVTLNATDDVDCRSNGSLSFCDTDLPPAKRPRLNSDSGNSSHNTLLNPLKNLELTPQGHKCKTSMNSNDNVQSSLPSTPGFCFSPLRTGPAFQFPDNDIPSTAPSILTSGSSKKSLNPLYMFQFPSTLSSTQEPSQSQRKMPFQMGF